MPTTTPTTTGTTGTTGSNGAGVISASTSGTNSPIYIGCGCGGASSDDTTPNDGTDPSQNGGLVLTITCGTDGKSLELSWTCTDCDPAQNFVLTKEANGAGSSIYSGTDKKYTDSDVEEGNQYSYTVTSKDKDGKTLTATAAWDKEIPCTPGDKTSSDQTDDQTDPTDDPNDPNNPVNINYNLTLNVECDEGKPSLAWKIEPPTTDVTYTIDVESEQANDTYAQDLWEQLKEALNQKVFEYTGLTLPPSGYNSSITFTMTATLTKANNKVLTATKSIKMPCTASETVNITCADGYVIQPQVWNNISEFYAGDPTTKFAKTVGAESTIIAQEASGKFTASFNVCDAPKGVNVVIKAYDAQTLGENLSSVTSYKYIDATGKEIVVANAAPYPALICAKSVIVESSTNFALVVKVIGVCGGTCGLTITTGVGGSLIDGKQILLADGKPHKVSSKEINGLHYIDIGSSQEACSTPCFAEGAKIFITDVSNVTPVFSDITRIMSCKKSAYNNASAGGTVDSGLLQWITGIGGVKTVGPYKQVSKAQSDFILLKGDYLKVWNYAGIRVSESDGKRCVVKFAIGGDKDNGANCYMPFAATRADLEKAWSRAEVAAKNLMGIFDTVSRVKIISSTPCSIEIILAP